jgi:hypothetical protein
MQDIDSNGKYYNKKENDWKKFCISLSKQFIYALSFKFLYKLTRNVDKLGIDNITIDKLHDILFSWGNIQFASVTIILRLLFKLFRYILKYKIGIDISESKHRYLIRFISLLYGKFVSFLVLLVGQKSNVIFYLILLLIVRSIIYIVTCYSDRQINNNNKDINKHMFYLGIGLGFVNMTVAFKTLREKIKVVNYLTRQINIIMDCFNE